MSQYREAREKTKAKIEKSYWELLMKKEKITVQKIVDMAKIHKSTFYFYYDWIDDVLADIKDRLMNQLIFILNSDNHKNGNFKEVMIDLRKMFVQNRKYQIGRAHV